MNCEDFDKLFNDTDIDFLQIDKNLSKNSSWIGLKNYENYKTANNRNLINGLPILYPLSIHQGYMFNDILSYETELQLSSVFKEELILARKFNTNVYHKFCRVKRFLNYIFEKYDLVLFLTLTFKPSVLNSTSMSTRRQYIRRYLSSFGLDCVANIDFGGKKGREHYHAIIGSNSKLDFSLYNDKYGNISFKKVNKSIDSSSGKISHYMLKLVYHSTKLSTFNKSTLNSRLIYLRKS